MKQHCIDLLNFPFICTSNQNKHGECKRKQWSPQRLYFTWSQIHFIINETFPKILHYISPPALFRLWAYPYPNCLVLSFSSIRYWILFHIFTSTAPCVPPMPRNQLFGIVTRTVVFHGLIIQLTLRSTSAHYLPCGSKEDPKTPKQNTLSLLFSSLQTNLFLFPFAKSDF